MRGRSLIIATLIGTMLDSYDNEDKTKLHRELQVRIRKGLNVTKNSMAALKLLRLS